MAQELGSADWTAMRWNRGMAVSAGVHLLHSAAIFLLILFVPAPADTWLRSIWLVAAFFTGMGLLVLLRVGSYAGTTDEEIGGLIRRAYWTATGLYLSLLAASLFFIFFTKAGRALR